MTTDWAAETLYPTWQQRFRVDRILFQEKTPLQDLVIFENAEFGRVMMLDGVTQLTERDEFIYHEMLAHVPLFGVKDPKKVLIIGGGDGGTLREVLRHRNVESVTLVEIDHRVIERGLEFMPSVSNGAYADPRANIVIGDGIVFVRDSTETFDVILIDSTDPVGPAEGLFSTEFYANCRARLAKGGVLALQGGVPFMQSSEIGLIQQRLSASFSQTGFYTISMATYVGGMMTLGWASDTPDVRIPDDLEERVNRAALDLKYYSAGVHRGSFALPPYIERLRHCL